MIDDHIVQAVLKLLQLLLVELLHLELLRRGPVVIAHQAVRQVRQL